MKILLIHTGENTDNSLRMLSLLRQMAIPVEVLPVKSPDDADIKQFAAFFSPIASEAKEDHHANTPRPENPTLVIILSSLSKRWFDFLAGFSCGSRMPLLVYGQEAIAGISREFASYFTFVETEASLRLFLEAEYEAFKKQEAAREIIAAQETLLRMGIPINGEALAQCVEEGKDNEVSLFLSAGFSPDTRNKAGVPLLSIAARKGNRAASRFLISSGAQVNARADDRGTSALMDSVLGSHYDLMTDLIDAGAEVNIKSKDGQTALVVAVGAGKADIVEALLKAGADPGIADSLGVSAKEYATLFHNQKILCLLSAYAGGNTEKR